MAIKIYNEAGEVTGYEPGIIYELVYAGQPFYVGETTDPARRLAEHQACGRNPEANPETKYQFIAALDRAGLEWTMREVSAYGSEGPEESEDERIMELLVSGVTLTNERKGNANWMTERQTIAGDMRDRGITSYREYQQVIKRELVRARSGTASPQAHPAVDQWLDAAWNRSLQPTKTRKAADLEEQRRLDAIADETLYLSDQLPLAEQIELMQNLILTWDQYGCSEQVRRRTEERLAFLQSKI